MIFLRYFNLLLFFKFKEIPHMKKRLTYLTVIYEFMFMRYLLICQKYLTNIGHSLVEPGSVCEINECIFLWYSLFGIYDWMNVCYLLISQKYVINFIHLLVKLWGIFEINKCIFLDIVEYKCDKFLGHLWIKMYEVHMASTKHFIWLRHNELCHICSF